MKDGILPSMEQTLSRRELLTRGGLTAAAGLAFVGLGCSNPNTKPLSQAQREATMVALGTPASISTPKSTEIAYSSDAIVVENRRLVENTAAAIQIDPLSPQKEATLWAVQSLMPHQQEINNIDQARLDEAQKKVQTIFTLMQNSENPHLKSAGRRLFTLVTNNKLRLVPQVPERATPKVPLQATSTIDASNTNVWEMPINAHLVLSDMDPVELAIQAAHEAEHINNINKYFDSLPSTLTASEKLLQLSQSYAANNKQEEIAEEGRAYAEQARTYLWSVRLGYVPRPRQDEVAAEFIRTGQNPSNPQWLGYIYNLGFKDLRRT